MKEIRDLHHRAMRLAEAAARARQSADGADAARLLREAFECESQAAALAKDDPTLEPTRSILHRSAGWLALECGELREAERLAAVGLSGNPPHSVAEELRELLEQLRRRPVDAAGGGDGSDRDGSDGYGAGVVEGRLLTADARQTDKGEITIRDRDGTDHLFVVPRGMMSDIVRPFFEQDVRVEYVPRNGRLELAMIEAATSAD